MPLKDTALRVTTPIFSVYRERTFIYVKLHGAVDDSIYEAWCRAVDDNIAAEGMPLYLCVDGEQAQTAATLAGRVRAAKWARGFKGKMRGGVIFLGAEHQRLLFVARSILRVVAIESIKVVNDRAELETTLRAWRTA